MLTEPVSAKATTSGGLARNAARTAGWMRNSKLRLPDNTAQATTLWSMIFFSISGSIGPEAPKQVPQL